MGSIKSDFAILDVKGGRKELLARVRNGERVPVVIRGVITAPWGRDDGVSTEFDVDVKSVQETA